MPGYSDVHIHDQKFSKGKKIYPKYDKDKFGNLFPIKDFGILTIMRNPLIDKKHIIGCMGIHGFGTLACHKVLTNQNLLQQLMDLIDIPVRDLGYQILVEYDTLTTKLKLLEKSLYTIEY